VEKIKTHIRISITLFKNHVVYESMWKNRAGQHTNKNKTGRIVCWVIKATNTHSGCVILSACPRQK